MEGKMRCAAVAGCLLIVVLLSIQVQQGGAAETQFCSCFKSCYPGCIKQNSPAAVCVPTCFARCPYAEINDCDNVCKVLTLCDLAAIEVGAPDLSDCVHDCKNFPGVPPAANRN